MKTSSKVLMVGLAFFCFSLFLFFQFFGEVTQLNYAKTLFSEKASEVIGFGNTAKTEIIAAREKTSGAGSTLTTSLTATSSTTISTAGKKYFGGGVITSTSIPNFPNPKTISQNSLDQQFERVVTDLDGSPELSCGSGRVFVVAVIEGDKLWEKKILISEDNTFISDPLENASIWISTSETVSEKLYTSLYSNKTKAQLTAEVLKYWISGDLKVYPIGEAKELFLCTTKP
ncbi:MAG: hypothetical protein ABH851_00995 [Methanobacteriota archaeon]